jgi:hypothetical protein
MSKRIAAIIWGWLHIDWHKPLTTPSAEQVLGGEMSRAIRKASYRG